MLLYNISVLGTLFFSVNNEWLKKKITFLHFTCCLLGKAKAMRLCFYIVTSCQYCPVLNSRA